MYNSIELTPSSSSEDSHHGNVLRTLPPSSSSAPSALLTSDLPSRGNQPLHLERDSPVAESVTSTVPSEASPTMATSDKNNNSRTIGPSNNTPPKKTAKKARVHL